MKSIERLVIAILLIGLFVVGAQAYDYKWQPPLAKNEAPAVAAVQASYNTPVAVSTCPACDAAAGQVVPPTPAEQAKVVKDYCAFSGGRWIASSKNGVQVAGFYDRETLMGPGLPLQAFFHQVNWTGKNQVVHGDLVIEIPDQEEMFNDGGGSQLIGCEDANGQLHIFEAERSNNDFNKVSYIVWTATGPIGYSDDTGVAGTWEGSPSGTTIAYHEVNSESVNPDLMLHYQAIVALMAAPTPAYFNNGIITIIW